MRKTLADWLRKLGLTWLANLIDPAPTPKAGGGPGEGTPPP